MKTNTKLLTLVVSCFLTSIPPLTAASAEAIPAAAEALERKLNINNDALDVWTGIVMVSRAEEGVPLMTALSEVIKAYDESSPLVFRAQPNNGYRAPVLDVVIADPADQAAGHAETVLVKLGFPESVEEAIGYYEHSMNEGAQEPFIQDGTPYYKFSGFCRGVRTELEDLLVPLFSDADDSRTKLAQRFRRFKKDDGATPSTAELFASLLPYVIVPLEHLIITADANNGTLPQNVDKVILSYVLNRMSAIDKALHPEA